MKKQLLRLRQIVGILRESPDASIQRLATLAGVSAMTVRRDLAVLAENDVIEVTPNGIKLSADSSFFQANDNLYSISAAETRFRDQKMRIARRAAELIQPEDIVIFDAGSTTEFLAKVLPDDLSCTIICYTLNALVDVNKKPACDVIFAGGFYHENTMMFESPEGVSLIRRIRANTAFISAAGISDRLGITCANEYELETKRAALASSMTRVLVADSTKFDKVRSSHFADLADFDVIVTDDGIPEKYKTLIENAGIKLLLV